MKWHVGMPGEYGTHNANTILDEHGDAICAVYGLPINTRLEDMTSEKWATGLANARLIAAAPALRDALAKIRDIAARVIDGAPDTLAAPLDEILAIAKAAEEVQSEEGQPAG